MNSLFEFCSRPAKAAKLALLLTQTDHFHQQMSTLIRVMMPTEAAKSKHCLCVCLIWSIFDRGIGVNVLLE